MQMRLELSARRMVSGGGSSAGISYVKYSIRNCKLGAIEAEELVLKAKWLICSERRAYKVIFLIFSYF